MKVERIVSSLALCFAVALGGCVGGVSPSLSVEALRGAAEDSGDPAAVLLVVYNGVRVNPTAICSASVIAPRVVLTAAHCLSPQLVGDDAHFGLFLGNERQRAGADTTEIAVTDTYFDPDWNPVALGHDIGLVATDAALPVEPLAINRQPLDASFVGSAVRAIGYGRTSDTDTSTLITKRQVQLSVSAVDAEHLRYAAGPAGACEGDSGGPTLLGKNGVEVVAGVHSVGKCDGSGADTRVDAYLDRIDPFVAAHPLATPDLGAIADAGDGAPSEGGCAMTSSPSGSSSWWVLVLVAVFILRSVARRGFRASDQRGQIIE